MEAVFCFEVAIETLKLRRRVTCGIPYVAIAFLDFPTIVIRLNEAKHNKTNEYVFGKGKSCLFKMSPTELYNRLTKTPVYVVILDQQTAKQPNIGTSSLDLAETIKEIIQDAQIHGLYKTTCHGNSLSVTVVNFLQDVVGFMQLGYKLTSLGHSMLPHLESVKVDDFNRKPEIKLSKPQPLCPLPTEENVVCPPALYYHAEKQSSTVHDNSDSKNPRGLHDATEKPSSNKDDKKKGMNLNFERSRERTVKRWRDETEAVIKINTLSKQKCEATQTDLKQLNQFPILQGLIEEVLQLGLNRPTSAPVQRTLPKPTTDAFSEVIAQRPISAQEKQTKYVVPAQMRRPQKSASLVKPTNRETNKEKRKYPLRYGLTKTHLLRLSQNKATELSSSRMERSHQQKPKKSKKSPPTKRKEVVQQKVAPPELASTFTQTMPNIAKGEISSISEDISSDDQSVTLNLHGNASNVDDIDRAQGRTSPRALSRQSIEIRLPIADTETVHEDPSNIYKYSDDFDEEKSWSYERTASAFTTLDSSAQNTAYDASRENTEAESPHRLTVDFSPQPTISDISPTISFGITPRDSIPEEPEKESMEIEDKTINQTDELEDNIITHFKPLPSSLSPRQDSYNDDDSKPTDDSAASVVTTLVTGATKLPIPAPSSDSPVIRSLASEPGGRKPRPPSASHSSSMERIHRRRVKLSSESSFHMSDISDVRTSDLADIKTSDLSDLKSSDENISPLNSTDMFGRKMSFPKLKKKFRH